MPDIPDREHPIRILHLEDDPRDAEIIRNKLKAAGLVCDIVLVDNRQTFEAALADAGFDVILCDYNLRDFDGLSAVKMARERQPEARVIVVSGTLGEEDAVACLHEGAADYLLKERLDRLGAAVKRAIEEAAALRERKEAERALVASEARLRQLMAASPAVIYTLQLRSGGLHPVWRSSSISRFGYHPEETLAPAWWYERVHPADRERAASVVSRLLEEGHAEHEYRFRHADGHYMWLYDSVEVLRGSTQGSAEVVGCWLDVTERKQAEEALRRSRDLLDSTGQLARIGGWEFDVESETLTWTEEVYRIHELDPATRLNVAEAINFYAPEARPVMSAAVQASIDSGTPWDLELPLITAQGRRIWVRAHGEAVRQGGRTVRIHGAFQDITERKQAEDAVIREKAFSEAMLDSLPGIFFLFDQTGRFLRWNRALETVSGYAPDEIAAMHPLDFFAEEDRARIGESIGNVFETGGAEVEATVIAKDGRRIPYYFVGVRFAVDGVPCCIGTGIDITARKHLEAQLRQSQKIEAIGRLAGGVAHDFNNILGVIMGYGEMAQHQLDAGHPVRARVDQIVKAAERAAGLTRQLLAFSRKQIMQPRLLDLNALVAGMQNMLGRLIGEDVNIVARAAPGLGTVKADPGQIEQVVMNLAVNARDAMPKGGSLTLETANVDLDEEYAASHPPTEPGPYVMLAVSDTGVGMNEETQQRIFEPFYTTKPEGEGTGLGLATVYGIVKQSGGYIRVYSEPGHGTTFKVYLPRVDEPAETVRAESPPAEALSAHETILLVEDTAMLREMISAALEELGYTVLLASNGEEALALARQHEGPIDLLLTDVVMPKLGGGELAKLLSALRPGLRVVYMSGYTDGAIAQHGVLEDGVVLLEKPFTVDTLARVLREVLDGP